MQDLNAGILAPLWVLYAFLLLFSVLGNCLLIVAVRRTPTLHTSAHVYICNMAIAALFYALLSTIFATQIGTGRWLFGRALCKIFSAATEIGQLATTLSMLCIAIVRVDVARLAIRERRPLCYWVVASVLIWIVSVAFAFPFHISSDVVLRGNGTSFCKTVEGISLALRWYHTAYTVILIFAPVILTVVLYAIVLHGSRRSLIDTKARPRESTLTRSSTKITRVVYRCIRVEILVSGTFGALLVPYHIMRVFRIHGVVIPRTVQLGSDLALVASTTAIPLIYAWRSSQMRQAVVRAVQSAWMVNVRGIRC